MLALVYTNALLLSFNCRRSMAERAQRPLTLNLPTMLRPQRTDAVCDLPIRARN